MFILIAIGVWICALVIWWVCSNAFRHSDLDKLKSRLLGTNKAKKSKAAGQNASLIQTEEKGGLLATRFLKRYQLQTKFQEMLEQAGMRWSTHRLVNTCLVAFVAGWGAARGVLPGPVPKVFYVPSLPVGRLPFLFLIAKGAPRLRPFEETFP